jgi:hypothetical protein
MICLELVGETSFLFFFFLFLSPIYFFKLLECRTDHAHIIAYLVPAQATLQIGLGMALNSAMRVCARVQIPVCPETPLVCSHELLGGLRTGFLVVSPLRIACAFLHVERGLSSKRVWRSPRIIYLLQTETNCAHFAYSWCFL